MKTINLEINGKEKTILADCTFSESESGPLIPLIFVHGFKGYKDWGCYDLIADHLASNGFLVLKFNFSFNGTTKDSPCEFVDLEAFGNNNFSRELADLDSVITYMLEHFKHLIDAERLSLIAHSRGGATAILKTAHDKRIKQLVTWASVATIEGRFPSFIMDEYKRTGVLYQLNSRTNQHMPVYYQMVKDYYSNEPNYDVLLQCSKVQAPTLLIHGDDDETVSVKEAKLLASNLPHAELEIIKGGDHSFGQSEPWPNSEMPKKLKEVLLLTTSFLKGENPN